MNIKEILRKHNKTQAWLVLELQKHNVRIHPSRLSNVLSGVDSTKSAKDILRKCQEILREVDTNEADRRKYRRIS